MTKSQQDCNIRTSTATNYRFRFSGGPWFNDRNGCVVQLSYMTSWNICNNRSVWIERSLWIVLLFCCVNSITGTSPAHLILWAVSSYLYAVCECSANIFTRKISVLCASSPAFIYSVSQCWRDLYKFVGTVYTEKAANCLLISLVSN